jgi:hypothetical protein
MYDDDDWLSEAREPMYPPRRTDDNNAPCKS